MAFFPTYSTQQYPDIASTKALASQNTSLPVFPHHLPSLSNPRNLTLNFNYQNINIS